ncbi:hypothetical protein G6F40_016860 [Rhizopus arrhizus]|nr:hypothetical protein G6F40_016860 [Rhizopus arrhizus]
MFWNHALAVERDRAAAGRQQAGDQVEHRGLAGAVGADQAEDRAFGHGQADVMQHMQAAEALGDGGKLKHGACLPGRPGLDAPSA